jgi:serine phosphatase RsbU (regulator of sigma subunit)/anti-sigma regulatory factor (Ser/Thr protein kinase)
MSEPSAQFSAPAVLRLRLPCELDQVRRAALRVREFLARENLSVGELMACELALVEACNNAVAYAHDTARQLPIEVEILCEPDHVELRVHDHTPGFEWPEDPELPGPESERGRGLFLIRRLMDHASYLRGRGYNCLRMRRSRSRSPEVRPTQQTASAAELQRLLAEREEMIKQMTEEISFCYESLSAIFRHGAELGKTLELEDFARRLLTDLLQVIGAEWFVLRVVDENDGALRVHSASDGDGNLPAIRPAVDASAAAASAEAEAAAGRQDVWFDAQRPLDAADPLRAIRPGSAGLVHPVYFGDTLFGTLTVGRPAQQSPFTTPQASVVHTFADFLAIQFVNARFREEQVRSRLMSHELGIAETIQRSLLPTVLPQVPGLGLAGFCRSACQVGGDFYDVLPLGEHRLLLVIADVMGKGIPAAMFAAILRSLVRAAPELSSQPAALLRRVNRLLHEDLSRVDMFITAQLVFVDAVQRRLVTASAGHCPLLLATATEPAVRAFAPEGLPLGILDETTFTEESALLAANCRLLLYTDGLTEARNAKGELFGQARLVDWLKHSTTQARRPEEVRDGLVAELTRFGTNEAFSDDQTFLLLADDPPLPI